MSDCALSLEKRKELLDEIKEILRCIDLDFGKNRNSSPEYRDTLIDQLLDTYNFIIKAKTRFSNYDSFCMELNLYLKRCETLLSKISKSKP